MIDGFVTLLDSRDMELVGVFKVKSMDGVVWACYPRVKIRSRVAD